jgi:RNA-directed DNA polymerase
MIVVRFADDIVVGFERKSDAKQFGSELTERFRKFKLELHPDKTRPLEFGRFAAGNRKKRGGWKPETFNFLGFTHISGRKRTYGMFRVLRQTMRKRLQAKLNEISNELQRCMYAPIRKSGNGCARWRVGTSPTMRCP